jgi:hypothetical protein
MLLVTSSSALFPLFHGNVVPYLPDCFGLDISLPRKGLSKVIAVIVVVNIPYYLHSFNTNYIIAQIVEMFGSCFIQMKKNCEGQHRFKKISFVKMKISKFIHYSIDVCQNH